MYGVAPSTMSAELFESEPAAPTSARSMSAATAGLVDIIRIEPTAPVMSKPRSSECASTKSRSYEMSPG